LALASVQRVCSDILLMDRYERPRQQRALVLEMTRYGHGRVPSRIALASRPRRVTGRGDREADGHTAAGTRENVLPAHPAGPRSTIHRA
jgi:hypothetical protein